jgi:ATP synthase protein I
MDERDPHASLRDLEKGLAQARQGRAGAQQTRRADTVDSRNALGQGLRIGMELVVAVIVGFGIGWLVDYGLGTRPWGMIVFFFLGIGAGLVNVYRTLSGLGMAMGYRRGTQPPPATGFEDEDED